MKLLEKKPDSRDWRVEMEEESRGRRRTVEGEEEKSRLERRETIEGRRKVERLQREEELRRETRDESERGGGRRVRIF